MLVVKYYDYDPDNDRFEIHCVNCLRIFTTNRGFLLELPKIFIPFHRIISISVKE